MKLVDILARELKEWPIKFGEFAISAPTEGTFAVWFNDRKPYPYKGGWADIGCVELWLEEEPEDRKTAIVTRTQWQAAVDALKAEVRPTESMALHHQEVGRITRQWNGEGLPPAETVVELRTVSAKTDWAKAKIKFASRNVVVWDWDGEPAISGLCTAYAHAIEMRPIRTPEQIAAEERERVIDTMVKSCPYPGSGCTRIDCAALYDAGYRKFEIVES